MQASKKRKEVPPLEFKEFKESKKKKQSHKFYSLSEQEWKDLRNVKKLFPQEAMVKKNLELLEKQLHYQPPFEQIGQGGFGSVYRAYRWKGKEKYPVAVKIFNTYARNIDEVEHELILQTQYAPFLQHALPITSYQIIRIPSDPEYEKYYPYAILAYSEMPIGKTLASFFKEGKKWESFSFLSDLYSLFCAVQEIHHVAIAHFDLKPENILFVFNAEQKKDHLYLADFGLATHEGATFSRDPPILVSQPYRPPEFLCFINVTIPPEAKYSGIINLQADMWSAGIIVMEWVASQLLGKNSRYADTPFWKNRENWTTFLQNWVKLKGGITKETIPLLNEMKCPPYFYRPDANFERPASVEDGYFILTGIFPELKRHATELRDKFQYRLCQNLISHLLRFDFRQRWTPQQACSEIKSVLTQNFPHQLMPSCPLVGRPPLDITKIKLNDHFLTFASQLKSSGILDHATSLKKANLINQNYQMQQDTSALIHLLHLQEESDASKWMNAAALVTILFYWSAEPQFRTWFFDHYKDWGFKSLSEALDKMYAILNRLNYARYKQKQNWFSFRSDTK